MSEKVWLQLTSGRGPVECARAVVLLSGRLLDEARAAGLAADILETTPGPEKDTAASALLSVEGDGAAAFADDRAGVVQWTCPSPYRAGHRRKNWFVGVRPLRPAPETGVAALDPRDLKVETRRASGPGGQNVNKRDTAVRVVHTPTGLTAQAQEERGQARNKSLAIARLAERLAMGAEADVEAHRDEAWRGHDALERGRPSRIYKGPAFKPA